MPLPILVGVGTLVAKAVIAGAAAGVAFAAADELTRCVIKWVRVSIAKIKDLMHSKNSYSAKILHYIEAGNYETLNIGLYDKQGRINEEVCIEAENVDSNIYEGLVITI